MLEQVVSGIADEEYQRRAWFGVGPYVSSPGEMINQLLGDASIEEFLDRNDTGMNDLQVEAGRYLAKLMDGLAKQSPTFIDPYKMIDDPRWLEIREAAKRFQALLSK
jgi:hypothetical protein